jgi:hypothetical protein
MVVYRFAAFLTVAGAVGFGISSLIFPSGAAGPVFVAAGLFTIAGPLLFFCSVMIQVLVEYWQSEHPALGYAGPVAAAGPSSPAPDAWMPEGLLREPKGPMSPLRGRADER